MADSKLTENTPVPRTLGLVGGLGLGAGIFYYRALVEAHKAHGLIARILMVHADSRRVMAYAADRAKAPLAEYLTDLLNQLARGGAQIATIPAFSPQLCAEELAVATSVPLISLLDTIRDEVNRRRFRKVACFGARVTMETQMFGTLQGIEVVTPRADEVDVIANRYARLVEEGYATEADFEQLRTLARDLIKREKLDGIVLAGTDLAFVFNPNNADFPHIDGARVHISAIMRDLLPGRVGIEEREEQKLSSASAD